MEPERIFAREPDLVTRTIAGETVIIPVSGRVCDLDSIYTLDAVGSRIWSLLDGSTPAGAIVEAICEEYEVEPDRAAEDLREFIGSLLEAGLIRSVGRVEALAGIPPA